MHPPPSPPAEPAPDPARAAHGSRLSRRGELGLVALVVLVASAARLYHLGYDRLWLDEAISFARSQLSLREIVAECVQAKHLPTYFFMLKGWLTFGDSEAFMRFPSAVFGVAAAGLAYGLGRTLGGPFVGLGTGLLVAISRLQIRYGQEARMYTMYSAWATLVLCALFFLVAQGPAAATSLRTPLRGGTLLDPARYQLRAVRCAWWMLSLGTTLCLYTHNTAVFLVVPINLAALWWWWCSPGHRAALARNWLTTQGVALLVWSLWLPTLVFQVGTFEQRWGRGPLTAGGILNAASQVYFNVAPALHWTTAALLLAAFFGMWTLRKRPALCGVVVISTLAAPIVCIIASQYKNMYFPRVMLWTAIPWCALLALGASHFSARARPLVLLGLLAIHAVPLPAYYAKHHKPNWPKVLNFLRKHKTPESIVFVSVRARRFETYYYGRKHEPLPRIESTLASCDDVTQCLEGHDEFWILGYPNEVKPLEDGIRRSGCCEEVRSKRIRRAVAIHYRLLPHWRGPGPAGPHRVQPSRQESGADRDDSTNEARLRGASCHLAPPAAHSACLHDDTAAATRRTRRSFSASSRPACS